MDLDLDDYKRDTLFAEWQDIVLDTAGILVVSTHVVKDPTLFMIKF